MTNNTGKEYIQEAQDNSKSEILEGTIAGPEVIRKKRDKTSNFVDKLIAKSTQIIETHEETMRRKKKSIDSFNSFSVEEQIELLEKNLSEALDGRKINEYYEIHTQPNGDFAGQVKVDGIWYPFSGVTLVTQIGGKKIQSSDNIHTQPNGTLAGRVEVDGIWYPFHGNTLVTQIGGKKIEGSSDIHTKSNGDLAGKVLIEGVLQYFKGNKLIKKVA